MKKVFFVFLVCLLLTACGENTKPTQQNALQPASSSVTTKPSGFGDGLIEHLHFEDIDSYNKFIEVADLPENFVHYESLKMFGEFYGLVFQSQKVAEYLAADYSKYSYIFIDEKGNMIDLCIGGPLLESKLPESKYWGDMQAGDPTIAKKHGSVERNGVEYYYLANELYYIAWEVDGIPFMLTTYVKGEVFYPEDGSLTIVHELLHTDTNKAALERFEASLNAPAVK